MDDTKSVHFTLSPSEASSRSSSPAPSTYNGTTTNLNDFKSKLNVLDDDHTPGRRARDVYDTTLSWWRAGVRRKLVNVVHWESQIISKMQVSSKPYILCRLHFILP